MPTSSSTLRRTLADRKKNESVKNFNECLASFVEALAQCFPENAAAFSLAKSALSVADQTAPSRQFFEKVSPHFEMLVNRNDLFFSKVKLDIPGIDLKEMWDDKGLSDSSRDAIWTYLMSLSTLSVTARFPPALLGIIESMAAKTQKRVEEGEVDIAGVVAEMMQPQKMAGLFQQIQKAGLTEVDFLELSTLGPTLMPLLQAASKLSNA
jgi:hypothetical protein